MVLRTGMVGGPSRPLAFTAITAKYQTPLSSVENSYEVCAGSLMKML
jgi:hypothetical protein